MFARILIYLADSKKTQQCNGKKAPLGTSILIYSAASLSDGNHTITIQNAAKATLTISSVVFTKRRVKDYDLQFIFWHWCSTNTNKPSSTSKGTIVGIVIGVLISFALITLGVILFVRRKRASLLKAPTATHFTTPKMFNKPGSPTSSTANFFPTRGNQTQSNSSHSTEKTFLGLNDLSNSNYLTRRSQQDPIPVVESTPIEGEIPIGLYQSLSRSPSPSNMQLPANSRPAVYPPEQINTLPFNSKPRDPFADSRVSSPKSQSQSQSSHAVTHSLSSISHPPTPTTHYTQGGAGLERQQVFVMNHQDIYQHGDEDEDEDEDEDPYGGMDTTYEEAKYNAQHLPPTGYAPSHSDTNPHPQYIIQKR